MKITNLAYELEIVSDGTNLQARWVKINESKFYPEEKVYFVLEELREIVKEMEKLEYGRHDSSDSVNSIA